MKMIRSICTLLAAALGACQAPATLDISRTPSPAAPEIGSEERPETSSGIHPALWKVSDEDTTIYLFGTVHILPKGIDWFGGEVAQAFDRSELLVTEIVEGDPLTMQALVADKAVLRGNQTLRQLLSEEERTAYEGALKGLGLPVGAFDSFEPWYASVGLSTLPLMQDGFAGEHGVEVLLDARAKQRGVAHEGLETAEYQLSLFDTLPMPVQKKYLSEVVSELPNIRSHIALMIEAWKAGDAEGLARIMNSSQSDPVLIERLLVSRNKVWARWVGERLDEPGTVFLAVGAGHLAGPGSLQDQLVAAGIASERIQ